MVNYDINLPTSLRSYRSQINFLNIAHQGMAHDDGHCYSTPYIKSWICHCQVLSLSTVWPKRLVIRIA